MSVVVYCEIWVVQALKHGYANERYEGETPMTLFRKRSLWVDEFDSSIEIPTCRFHFMGHKFHKISD